MDNMDVRIEILGLIDRLLSARRKEIQRAYAELEASHKNLRAQFDNLKASATEENAALLKQNAELVAVHVNDGVGSCYARRVEDGKKIAALLKRATEAERDLEQTRVQLAGCLVAADGGEYPTERIYGWSPAGARVAEIRKERDVAIKRAEAAERLHDSHCERSDDGTYTGCVPPWRQGR